MSVISISGLTKDYTDFWGRPKLRAVDGLSFEVEKGQVFGLLGPNGSGKTTTMKVLLGLLRPTEGGVRVLGGSPRDAGLRARIGFMPEETALYRFLSADETLDFFGRLFELPTNVRRKRADELLRTVGLAESRSRPVGEYSRGMGRRLMFAQALINDPELVVLDEPTSGLDPVGAREMKDLIRDLGSRGKTVLLSSHLLADVEDVCDRIAIIHRGRLRALGRVDELLEMRGRVRFTTRELSDSEKAEIERILKEMAGEITVDRPRERLESLFLRVIGERKD